MTTTQAWSPATATPASIAAPDLWCRDLVSCLQATFATLLRDAGHDPLEVLGAHWEFRYQPGDVRPEEFYYPCRVPGDLAASLAPHHPVSSRWQQPGAGHDPLAALTAVLAAGQLPVAAVDNFYLPFRPAFGDVHAAHLIVVHDVRAGQVTVSDGMPPAFSGDIPAADFLRAWSSPNPRDAQDVFFSAAKIDRRFLTLTIGERFPRLDPALLRQVLAANLAGFAEGPGPEGTAWTGLDGLDRFLGALLAACAHGDGGALADVYPFGWGMQAQASLHAELLRRLGAQADIPELREAGRHAEATAHAWTGLRMTAAHGRDRPEAAARDLARHAARLRRGYERATAAAAEVVAAL
jgi:hypothetical protein